MEVALGFMIAAAIGLTGVGGGVITAPVLILWLGLPAPVAVGSALAFVSVVKSLAVPVYLRRGEVDWRALRLLCAGGIPAALAGGLALRYLDTRSQGDLVLAAVGVAVVFSACLSLWRMLVRRGAESGADRPRALAASGAAIGLEVGFSSAGAGALGTVALFHFTRLGPATVVGTDLLFGFLVSVAGGSLQFLSGTYDAAILWRLVAGGIPGVLMGTWLAKAFPKRVLRAAILTWLVAIGSQLCYRAVAAMLHARG